ncbi:PspC domain-containing protein [Virgibacillus soli]|uniref:PspC domain-containing protein n=1 Tax=Paracerasibacillus soli TaxID=480284 RepID=A0ABU5CRA0_9BACI|nr:PspC domain-containing protein [Virgibacillus soli]MDY0408900.1 PspC domain-containing protein [Virgibacillus soli]
MKRLYRSTKDRYVAGVLGGLGIYLKVDPNILRLLFVIGLVFTAFFGLALVYLAAALLIPSEGGSHI